MTRLDTDASETIGRCLADQGPVARLFDAREVPLGGIRGNTVHRSLPQRQLPMVGAWCFLDRFDDDRADMRVLPHPHIGLQTVTWPVAGDIRHRDSVGSDVVVRPRQLNIMTAGRGISHSEFSIGDHSLPMSGLQLWTALPGDMLSIDPFFEQHTELPVFTSPGLAATVFVGTMGDATSDATAFTPLIGADATLQAGRTASLPLDSTFEHAVMVIEGTLDVSGVALEPGPLLYLGTGRDSLEVSTRHGSRFVLLGGTPFAEEIIMWWNFVGRTHEEIVQAREDWEEHSPRFGTVAGHGTERIPAPPLPNVRLTPRRRG